MNTFENKLLQREQKGNIRYLPTLQSPSSLIDFSSNDSLGLSRSSSLHLAVFQEWSKHSTVLNGLSSTGSRLLTGDSTYAQALEATIAAFHGFQAGLLFNCGYMANVGLLSTVADEETSIFFDTAVHASTRDGIRLSRATAFPFKHNDLEHLEKRLKSSLARKHLICIESIYSMDGSRAPLLEIYQLAKQYEAQVIVDEAHAVGLYGAGGRGLTSAQDILSPLLAKVVTFGKALGAHGAIVLCNHNLKHALINFASSFIYTTALPLISLAAIQCSYRLFPNLEAERNHLRYLMQLISSKTHIHFFPVKGNAQAKALSKHLFHKGFDVRPIMSPTVQRGCEGLRVCLHAYNTEQEVMVLQESLA